MRETLSQSRCRARVSCDLARSRVWQCLRSTGPESVGSERLRFFTRSWDRSAQLIQLRDNGARKQLLDVKFSWGKSTEEDVNAMNGAEDPRQATRSP